MPTIPNVPPKVRKIAIQSEGLDGKNLEMMEKETSEVISYLGFSSCRFHSFPSLADVVRESISAPKLSRSDCCKGFL